jgi:hypothetical protein
METRFTRLRRDAVRVRRLAEDVSPSLQKELLSLADQLDALSKQGGELHQVE